MGHPVTRYNRTAENLGWGAVAWRDYGRRSGTGIWPGFHHYIGDAEALAGADVVMVVTPSTAHRELAVAMAPHVPTVSSSS